MYIYIYTQTRPRCKNNFENPQALPKWFLLRPGPDQAHSIKHHRGRMERKGVAGTVLASGATIGWHRRTVGGTTYCGGATNMGCHAHVYMGAR